MAAKDVGKVEVRSASDLWAWLEAHHCQRESVWLVTWKAAFPELYVSRDEVLDALLAYGWIDGRRMKLDADRTMQLIAPRSQEVWARSYRDRFARLEREGRVKPAGRAAFERARQSGLLEALEAVDALEEPDDLVAGLAAAGGLDWWRAAAPSYRRNILRWIATAKRPETRAKRIGIVADHAALARKVPQY
ncbi:YdeI/OmpD-associated family protein [Roseicyclus marinus]|uniref:YdeI/OmpD-associated family protein n=1 Tax=Roseicyclus marinus TaxID=2161673 RepID=UPI0024108CEA|nr:YdeI/OmpD-associated family protein [Roseicyclus marinus]MDG3040643.1 YdeI/OmpD-associated family protein [Roseicyclus marinus]